MHILFRQPDWEVTVATAFASSEEELRSLLDCAQPDDLYALRDLAMALEHASHELASRVWSDGNLRRLQP